MLQCFVAKGLKRVYLQGTAGRLVAVAVAFTGFRAQVVVRVFVCSLQPGHDDGPKP